MNEDENLKDTDSDIAEIPESLAIVRAWLDITDHDNAHRNRPAACGNFKDTHTEIDPQQPYQLQHYTGTQSPTPSDYRRSVLSNLVPSPPPAGLLDRTSGSGNRRVPWSSRRDYIDPIGCGHHPQPRPLSVCSICHPTHQRLILPGPSARPLVETCADTPSSSSFSTGLASAPTDPETLANTPGPFHVPATESEVSIVADSVTFVRNLSSTTLPTGVKRKRSYPSQSITSVISDIRAKRRAMQRLSPPLSFAFGPLNYPPQLVAAFLTRFDMVRIEYGCIPWTPAVEALLKAHNPLAYYPPHARNSNIPEAEEPRALTLAAWVLGVYVLIVGCTERAHDGATWAAPVRQLLCLVPPTEGSCVPIPPPAVPCDQLLTTIDATTKLTRKTILPDYPTVKVDALLAFNPNHQALHSITRAVSRHGVVVNALSDSAIDDHIVLVGVVINGPSGDAAPATAEYQFAVWGAKSLDVARQLGIAGVSDWCDVAIGLAVCGHLWSAYVVFWEVDEDGERTLVVYGPVEVASSANVYGVFKLVAWMAEINVWAVEVLECWKKRVADARRREEVVVVV